MQIRSVGIDLGKTTSHLVALGEGGKVQFKKKFTQKQLITFTANLQTSLIGMEACSGAHFLGRALRSQGHDVRLIPAQFVKPFVKSNKNDSSMPKRLLRRSIARTCASFRSKQTTSLISRRCTVYGIVS
jgi:transposase